VHRGPAGTIQQEILGSILGHFRPFPSHFFLMPARQVVFPGIFTQNSANFQLVLPNFRAPASRIQFAF
jgi:hypothetical protein